MTDINEAKEHFTQLAVKKASQNRMGYSKWMYWTSTGKEYYVTATSDGRVEYTKL